MTHRGVGEIRAEVVVSDGVGGQLTAGSNMIRMRVNGVLGNTVAVLPYGAGPKITTRAQPIGLLPRRPVPFFGREDETQQVLAELTAHRSVALQTSPGMGMSTLVRHLARHPDIAAVHGAAVCLSARGQSRDDVLQALFLAFHTSDGPVRPTRGQLRHLMRVVHAVVLLDDVDLPAGALAELQDVAPNCVFVLAGARTDEIRSVQLSGLPVDAAGELLAHVIGYPVDRSAVFALWGLTRGAPAALVQLGASAAAYPGPLAEYVSAALHEALPPFTVDTPQERHLLGLLAAVPGMALSAQQLAAIAGVPDAAAWLRRWVECGLVTRSEADTYRFTGGRLDPVVWQLGERRAELIAAFASWARRHPEAVLVAGASAEPFRVLQELARRQQAWRAVLALGAPLDVAYALGGHWDAWHAAQQATLDAARALGDQPVEALTLHQLGTHALCRGDLATARKLLGAALELRLALGQTTAAAVTRRNLATITDQPARRGFAASLGRIPMAVKVAAVLVPLLGSLAFVGLAQAGAAPSASLNPQRLTFAQQTVDKASPPQIIRLGNVGRTALHVDNVALGGPNHGAFTLVDTSCVGAVAAGGECTATVVFTPAAPGEQQASLSWRIREIADEMSSPLVGVGVAAPAPVPAPAAVVAPAAVPPPVPAPAAVVAPAAVPTLAPAPVVVPAPVAVPVLVGQSQAEATARLDALGLRVGQVGRRSDPKIATGALIATDPQPGTPLPRGSAVDLVISTGVARVAVPAVVGRSLASARTLLGQRGLAVGQVTTQPSTTAKGVVIGSKPAFGALVAPGAAVGLVVSSGPAVTTVAVPDVVGQSLADAQALITAQKLAVGPVTAQPSSSVAKGVVIGSSPRAGAQVASGAAVGLVVSSGPAVTTVAVPDVAGSSLADARALIVDQNLAVGSVRTLPSSSVPKGVVIGSAPGAGAQVASGTRVSLMVSGGPAVTTVAVPDVANSSLAEARSLVTGAQLVVGTVRRQASTSVPAGQVIGSTPGAGAQVVSASRVSLVVSSGTSRAVPAVVGLSVAQATARLQAAGLKAVAVDTNGRTVKAGTVVDADPAAGEPAPASGRVQLTVQAQADG